MFDKTIVQNESGVRFCREYAKKLSEYEYDRLDLTSMIIDIIRKATGKNPDWIDDSYEMDPFTAMAALNRGYSDKVRISICRGLADLFGIQADIPDSFFSIPLCNNQNSIFLYRDIPGEEYSALVDKLWTHFRSFVSKQPQEGFASAFDEIISMRGSGIAKLTMALYWIDYERYISLDKHSYEFYRNRLDIGNDRSKIDGLKYLDINRKVADMAYSEGSSIYRYTGEVWLKGDGGDEGLFTYETGITSSQWLEMIDGKVILPLCMELLAGMYENGGSSTCKNIARKNGRHPSAYISSIVNTAKAVVEKTKVPLLEGDDGKCYYPVLFEGKALRKSDDGTYLYTIRTELYSALETYFENSSKGEYIKEYIRRHPLNTILYGPPGTGKTYNTFKKAVEIIDGYAPYEFRDIKSRYDQLVSDGRIEFVTFHQSYSYEEFIEGIRPCIDRDEAGAESGNLGYELRSGIFKTFCENVRDAKSSDLLRFVNSSIRKNPTVWKVSLYGSGDNPVRTDCLENGRIRIGWDAYGKDILPDENYPDGGKVVLNAFLNSMVIGDIVLSCYTEDSIDAIGVVTGEYEWIDDVHCMKRSRKVNWLKRFDEPYNIVKLNGGVRMVQMSVYRMNRISLEDILSLIGDSNLNVSTISENYVFIIDEVNRGNISRIFGEVMTLLEESKRVGSPEALEIRLPYSGDRFGIPSNIYVIGTMNTADRSLVSLDTALRRRFDFEEMLPDYKLLKATGCGVDLGKMLEAINKRIEERFDKEHVIGHAYLINATDETLPEVFRRKIIPLLQEYFYDDPSSIEYVLSGTGKTDFMKNSRIAPAEDKVWKDPNSYMSIYTTAEKDDDGN